MVTEQVFIFMWTLLIGTIMAIIFDFFRVLRRKGNTRDIWVYIQDVIFWIIVAVIIIVSTFLINDGELRGYMLIGYILGALFYMLLFSDFIRKVLSFILDLFDKIFKSIGKILLKIIEVLKNNKFSRKNVKI